MNFTDLNTYLKIAVLSIAVVLPIGVSAQDAKVGFVNTTELLEKAPQADTARDNLEKEFSPREKRLVAEQKELRQLEEKLTRDGAVMSDSERQKLERDIVSGKRDLKRSRDEFSEDLNIRKNEELAKLQKIIFESIQEYAKEAKYDLVITGGVVYANEKVDITSQVLDKLKKQVKK